MKSMLIMAIAIAGLSSTSALAQGRLEGRWKNGPMEIVIGPCGQQLCGTVVKASAKQQEKAERGSGTQLLGSKIIDKIEETGPGTWDAEIFVASRDMYARGTIEQAGTDQLTVRACVSIICKTSQWTRLSSDVDPALTNNQ